MCNRLPLNQLGASNITVQGRYNNILIGVTVLIPSTWRSLVSRRVRNIRCPAEGDRLNIVRQYRLTGGVDEVNCLGDVDRLSVLGNRVVLSVVDINHQVTGVVIEGNALDVRAIGLISWCDQSNVLIINGW